MPTRRTTSKSVADDRDGVEQARLADPGLPPHHQDTAQPVSRALDEPADLGLFGLTANERDHAISIRTSQTRTSRPEVAHAADSGRWGISAAIEGRRGLRGGGFDQRRTVADDRSCYKEDAP